MIEIDIQYICIIDRKPINESEAYQLLIKEVGQEIADKWVIEDDNNSS